MNEAEQFRAVITGRVHGVGFRMFVADHARALSLRGYVRNLPGADDWDNGSQVEVVASGPRPALEALLRQLNAGPPAAHVRDVKVEWGRYGEFPSFEVRD
jgi:acylphosphatase